MRASLGILPCIFCGILLAAWYGVPAGAAPQAEVRTAASPRRPARSASSPSSTASRVITSG